MIYKGVNLIKSRWVSHFHLDPYMKKKALDKYVNTRDNTIAIFANPRSGSTWFANLINHMAQSAVIDEPLWRGFYRTDNTSSDMYLHGKFPELNELGFFFNQPIPETESWPEAGFFFNNLFSLQFLRPSILNETTIVQLKMATRFIFKFNYANLMAPWIMNNFELRAILLLRHPCAVVSSQLEHPAFRLVKKCGKFLIPDCPYNDFFRQHENILTSISKPEEILAATWSMNYLSTAKHPLNNKKWITTTYERLVLNPFDEMKRIFIHLDQVLPDTLLHQLEKTRRRPDLHEQLSKWKRKLSRNQIANILNVIDQFGINAYTESIEPDYERILDIDL